MQPLNPLKYPKWDETLLNTEGSSFFHTSNWARVLHESYNYTPLYFAELQDNRFSHLIPIMEVNSLLTGKRGVSLPFTDNCPIIMDDPSIKKKSSMNWFVTVKKSSGNTLNSEINPFVMKRNLVPHIFILIIWHLNKNKKT